MLTGFRAMRASLVVNTDIFVVFIGPGFNSISQHRNKKRLSDVFIRSILHLFVFLTLGLFDLHNLCFFALPVCTDKKMAALHADDTKVYNSIRSIADCEKVQQELTNLDRWRCDNNLDFNSSKCKVLTITRRKSPLTYGYQINSKAVSRVEKEKDLGVCVNSKLSWNDHNFSPSPQKGTKCLDF